MEQYQVIVTPQAKQHIQEYAAYIRDTLQNRAAAERFVRDLWDAAQSLRTFPKRSPLVTQEPWSSMQIRTLQVRGYLMYYLVMENSKAVSVLAVIQGKRDQSQQLSQLHFLPGE